MPIDLVEHFADLMPDATLLVSAGGVIASVNRSLAKLLALEPHELRDRPLTAIASDPPETIASYLRACSRTRENVVGELCLSRNGSDQIPCRSEGALLRPGSDDHEALVVLRLLPKGGTVGEFLALTQKINELNKEVHLRKRVEEELRRQREWFRVTLSSIGDAIIATDDKERVVFMNPVAEILTGWIESDAQGKDLTDVFALRNEQTRSVVENPVGAVLATGKVVALANQTVLIARDQTETPIDDSAAPITDDEGRVLGVVLVFRDARENRRGVEARERLAAIVESSDEIIVSKTLGGIITSWNKGAERVLGYTAEEVVGKHVSMLMPPENREDTNKILSQIARGQRVDHYETKRRRKDGTVIDVSLTVSPIRDARGRVFGASKIGRDITLVKRAEKERQDADHRKDEFLAMLAHELRNPIAAINNAVRLFGIAGVEEELEWAKTVINRQVKHLARLIDDLLDVSRITRGKIQLRRERVDLAPILDSAIDDVKSLIEERKHKLTVSSGPGTIHLDADPLRVEQILVNLLNNAAKYTESGGQIWLTARREETDVIVTVRDTGVGISAEKLPAMFELFAQGDRSMARSEGGLGIGLTIVQRLAEMHGGSVTAASGGPAMGSEFTVRLPAAKEPPGETPNPRRTGGAKAAKNSRVLIVDDNVDSAKGLAKLLRVLGHDVRVAYDGSQAIEPAREHRPVIVLLDIGLPGMNGYEVAAKLRQEDCCRDAVLIAVTGYGQDKDKERSRQAGFDHHLVKPVDYNALLALISEPG